MVCFWIQRKACSVLVFYDQTTRKVHLRLNQCSRSHTDSEVLCLLTRTQPCCCEQTSLKTSSLWMSKLQTLSLRMSPVEEVLPPDKDASQTPPFRDIPGTSNSERIQNFVSNAFFSQFRALCVTPSSMKCSVQMKSHRVWLISYWFTGSPSLDHSWYVLTPADQEIPSRIVVLELFWPSSQAITVCSCQSLSHPHSDTFSCSQHIISEDKNVHLLPNIHHFNYWCHCKEITTWIKTWQWLERDRARWLLNAWYLSLEHVSSRDTLHYLHQLWQLSGVD